MNPFNYFDRKICLTLDGSPMYDQLEPDKKKLSDARWLHIQREFQRVGLNDVIKFPALADIGSNQSFNRSIRQILIDFWESSAKRLLILEDDCEFKDVSHMGEAISELPEHWDIFYLGANIQDNKPEKISPHIHRVKDAWTTHAIAYQRSVIPYLLENQPGFSEQMFDNWQGGAALPRFNSYIINPMVAWQKPGHSFIWKRQTDYSEDFIESQKKLA